jgi:hypothetical protein
VYSSAVARVLDPVEVGPTCYHITVLNPNSDVRPAEFNGVAVDPHAIPLLGDSAMPEVVVVLGRGDSTALELSSDDPTSSTNRDSSTD